MSPAGRSLTCNGLTKAEHCLASGHRGGSGNTKEGARRIVRLQLGQARMASNLMARLAGRCLVTPIESLETEWTGANISALA